MQFSKIHASSLMVASAALAMTLATGTSALASSITLQGTTTGCFGVSCSDFGDQKSMGGLTFDGSSFTLQIDDITNPATVSFLSGSFGTMALAGESITSSDFTLLVDVTSSGGATPASGSVSASTTQVGKSGNIRVEWQSDPSSFLFSNSDGSGAFSFTIRDQVVNPSGPRTLTPLFTDVRFSPATTTPEPIVAVPEPGGMLLLVSGLCVGAARMRKRRR